MAEHSTVGETFLVYGEYPHNLMQHILTLLRTKKKKEDWLVTEEFQKSFSEKYSDFSKEIKEIQLAAQKGVLRGFMANHKADDEKKKSFVQNSLKVLMESLREFEAVELMESLMWVFGWEVVVEVVRSWEVSDEDRANFHNFDELELYKKKQKEKEKKNEKEEKQEGAQKIGKQAELKTKPAKTEKEKQTVSNEKQMLYENKTVGKNTGTSGVLDKKVLDKKRFFKIILGMDLLEEERYRRLLQEIRIEYENQMHLSMRKELKRARRGNDISQTNLAEFYAEECTEHTDYFAAAMWYSFAARQGNDKARLELAKLLDGKKLLEDEPDVMNAEKEYHTKRHAILYFKELAEKGYPAAQGILGMKYYLGDGVRKSTAKGISWLKKAAEQGQVEAQKQLGEIYSEIDEAESQKWFRLAGAAGDPWAKTRIK